MGFFKKRIKKNTEKQEKKQDLTRRPVFQSGMSNSANLAALESDDDDLSKYEVTEEDLNALLVDDDKNELNEEEANVQLKLMSDEIEIQPSSNPLSAIFPMNTEREDPSLLAELDELEREEKQEGMPSINTVSQPKKREEVSTDTIEAPTGTEEQELPQNEQNVRIQPDQKKNEKKKAMQQLMLQIGIYNEEQEDEEQEDEEQEDEKQENEKEKRSENKADEGVKIAGFGEESVFPLKNTDVKENNKPLFSLSGPKLPFKTNDDFGDEDIDEGDEEELNLPTSTVNQSMVSVNQPLNPVNQQDGPAESQMNTILQQVNNVPQQLNNVPQKNDQKKAMQQIRMRMGFFGDEDIDENDEEELKLPTSTVNQSMVSVNQPLNSVNQQDDPAESQINTVVKQGGRQQFSLSGPKLPFKTNDDFGDEDIDEEDEEELNLPGKRRPKAGQRNDSVIQPLVIQDTESLLQSINTVRQPSNNVDLSMNTVKLPTSTVNQSIVSVNQPSVNQQDGTAESQINTMLQQNEQNVRIQPDQKKNEKKKAMQQLMIQMGFFGDEDIDENDEEELKLPGKTRPEAGQRNDSIIQPLVLQDAESVLQSINTVRQPSNNGGLSMNTVKLPTSTVNQSIVSVNQPSVNQQDGPAESQINTMLQQVNNRDDQDVKIVSAGDKSAMKPENTDVKENNKPLFSLSGPKLPFKTNDDFGDEDIDEGDEEELNLPGNNNPLFKNHSRLLLQPAGLSNRQPVKVETDKKNAMKQLSRQMSLFNGAESEDESEEDISESDRALMEIQKRYQMPSQNREKDSEFRGKVQQPTNNQSQAKNQNETPINNQQTSNIQQPTKIQSQAKNQNETPINNQQTSNIQQPTKIQSQAKDQGEEEEDETYDMSMLDGSDKLRLMNAIVKGNKKKHFYDLKPGQTLPPFLENVRKTLSERAKLPVSDAYDEEEEEEEDELSGRDEALLNIQKKYLYIPEGNKTDKLKTKKPAQTNVQQPTNNQSQAKNQNETPINNQQTSNIQQPTNNQSQAKNQNQTPINNQQTSNIQQPTKNQSQAKDQGEEEEDETYDMSMLDGSDKLMLMKAIVKGNDKKRYYDLKPGQKLPPFLEKVRQTLSERAKLSVSDAYDEEEEEEEDELSGRDEALLNIQKKYLYIPEGNKTDKLKTKKPAQTNVQQPTNNQSQAKNQNEMPTSILSTFGSPVDIDGVKDDEDTGLPTGQRKFLAKKGDDLDDSFWDEFDYSNLDDEEDEEEEIYDLSMLGGSDKLMLLNAIVQGDDKKHFYDLKTGCTLPPFLEKVRKTLSERAKLSVSDAYDEEEEEEEDELSGRDEALLNIQKKYLYIPEGNKTDKLKTKKPAQTNVQQPTNNQSQTKNQNQMPTSILSTFGSPVDIDGVKDDEDTGLPTGQRKFLAKKGNDLDDSFWDEFDYSNLDDEEDEEEEIYDLSMLGGSDKLMLLNAIVQGDDKKHFYDLKTGCTLPPFLEKVRKTLSERAKLPVSDAYDEEEEEEEDELSGRDEALLNIQKKYLYIPEGNKTDKLKTKKPDTKKPFTKEQLQHIFDQMPTSILSTFGSPVDIDGVKDDEDIGLPTGQRKFLAKKGDDLDDSFWDEFDYSNLDDEEDEDEEFDMSMLDGSDKLMLFNAIVKGNDKEHYYDLKPGKTLPGYLDKIRQTLSERANRTDSEDDGDEGEDLDKLTKGEEAFLAMQRKLHLLPEGKKKEKTTRSNDNPANTKEEMLASLNRLPKNLNLEGIVDLDDLDDADDTVSRNEPEDDHAGIFWYYIDPERPELGTGQFSYDEQEGKKPSAALAYLQRRKMEAAEAAKPAAVPEEKPEEQPLKDNGTDNKKVPDATDGLVKKDGSPETNEKTEKNQKKVEPKPDNSEKPIVGAVDDKKTTDGKKSIKDTSERDCGLKIIQDHGYDLPQCRILNARARIKGENIRYYVKGDTQLEEEIRRGIARKIKHTGDTSVHQEKKKPDLPKKLKTDITEKKPENTAEKLPEKTAETAGAASEQINGLKIIRDHNYSLDKCRVFNVRNRILKIPERYYYEGDKELIKELGITPEIVPAEKKPSVQPQKPSMQINKPDSGEEQDKSQEDEDRLKKEELRKKAAEEEKLRKAEEEKLRRVEEEEKLRKAEEEKLRKAEKEKLRRAEEEEKLRKAAEEEKLRKAAEEEKLRKAAEEEKLRKAEEEKLRKAEEEKLRKAEEEEKLRKAEEEEKLRKAEEEKLRKAAEEQEKSARKSEQEAEKERPKYVRSARIQELAKQMEAERDQQLKKEKELQDDDSRRKAEEQEKSARKPEQEAEKERPKYVRSVRIQEIAKQMEAERDQQLTSLRQPAVNQPPQPEMQSEPGQNNRIKVEYSQNIVNRVRVLEEERDRLIRKAEEDRLRREQKQKEKSAQNLTLEAQTVSAAANSNNTDERRLRPSDAQLREFPGRKRRATQKRMTDMEKKLSRVKSRAREFLFYKKGGQIREALKRIDNPKKTKEQLMWRGFAKGWLKPPMAQIAEVSEVEEYDQLSEMTVQQPQPISQTEKVQQPSVNGEPQPIPQTEKVQQTDSDKAIREFLKKHPVRFEGVYSKKDMDSNNAKPEVGGKSFNGYLFYYPKRIYQRKDPEKLLEKWQEKCFMKLSEKNGLRYFRIWKQMQAEDKPEVESSGENMPKTGEELLKKLKPKTLGQKYKQGSDSEAPQESVKEQQPSSIPVIDEAGRESMIQPSQYQPVAFSHQKRGLSCYRTVTAGLLENYANRMGQNPGFNDDKMETMLRNISFLRKAYGEEWDEKEVRNQETKNTAEELRRLTASGSHMLAPVDLFEIIRHWTRDKAALHTQSWHFDDLYDVQKNGERKLIRSRDEDVNSKLPQIAEVVREQLAKKRNLALLQQGNGAGGHYRLITGICDQGLIIKDPAATEKVNGSNIKNDHAADRNRLLTWESLQSSSTISLDYLIDLDEAENLIGNKHKAHTKTAFQGTTDDFEFNNRLTDLHEKRSSAYRVSGQENGTATDSIYLPEKYERSEAMKPLDEQAHGELYEWASTILSDPEQLQKNNIDSRKTAQTVVQERIEQVSMNLANRNGSEGGVARKLSAKEKRKLLDELMNLYYDQNIIDSVYRKKKI